MYDLIIIGSGPAGLSAAVYGIRAGLNLLVIEKNPMSGGQILNTYEVDNYLGLPGISGYDMGQKFREHADKLGVPFVEATVKSVTVGSDGEKSVSSDGEESAGGRPRIMVHTRRETYEARAVLLATGAEHAHLGVPGEEELSGMGVSYCATCDGAFFRGRTVAVVGGGDVALEDAIYLARTCEKVYLIHRRDELRGAKILQEELKALPNVEILYSHTVQEIQGEDAVENLILKNVKTGAEEQLSVAGVFIAVGIHPCSELVQGLVSCNEAGYVLAGEDGVTDCPGIFVAGDIRKKPLRQVVTAVADGANAVTSIGEFLKK